MSLHRGLFWPWRASESNGGPVLLCATGVWSFGPNGCAEKYAGGAPPPTCRPGSTMWGEQGSALDGCTGAPCQDSRLRHIPAATELWNPPPATNVCARSEWCGPHVCTSSYFCRSRPPFAHLQCHSSPSGSYHPRCHLPQLCLLGSICAVTMVKAFQGKARI